MSRRSSNNSHKEVALKKREEPTVAVTDNLLRNRYFENLGKKVNRSSFCEAWDISHFGAPQVNRFAVSREEGENGKHLKVEIKSVKKWLRISQTLSHETLANKSFRFSMTYSALEGRESIAKIDKITIMEISDLGFASVHSVIARDLTAKVNPEAQEFSLILKPVNRALKYILAFEFRSASAFKLWDVELVPLQLSELPLPENNSVVGTSKLAAGESSGRVSNTNLNRVTPATRTNALQETVKAKRRNPDAKLEYSWRIDRAEPHRISGWAVQPSDNAAVFDIDVLINGVFYCSIRNNRSRSDLKSKGIAQGLGGYGLDLPPQLTAAGPVEIFLRFPNRQTTDVRTIGSSVVSIKPAQRAISLLSKPPAITVVVPVYNAAEDLQLCIDSLIRNADIPARLLFIDDASPDKQIKNILEEAKKHHAVSVLYNQKNLGFTGTVNRGIKEAGNDDVVLLNSDARVTPGWLRSLSTTAYSHGSIATVTPMSDNAGAFSAPEIAQANPLPSHISEDDFAVLVRRYSDRLHPVVPTGNGFCMYVKRACIDAIGRLDEKRFPRGYGEENDFCMRANRAGWFHVMDDGCYVFHERSKSFGEEKHELMSSGRTVLDELYPEYGKLTPEFRSERINFSRFRVRQALQHCLSGHEILPRILFVYATQTGGTPQTNRDLMLALADSVEAWTLRCDSQTLYLGKVVNGDIKIQQEHRLLEPVHPVTHHSTEYDTVVSDWLMKHGFSIVHIRHQAWHSSKLPELAKAANASVMLSFHDFYTICPSVNLLDENNRYCGGQCTTTTGNCKAPLWPTNSLPALKNAWVQPWREKFAETFTHCDAFVTTSVSARDTMVNTYPQLKDRINVIPHGRDFSSASASCTPPDVTGRLKILLPGNIGISKGIDVVLELLQLDTEQQLDFHVLGTCESVSSRPGLTFHGAYQRHEILDRVNRISPTVAAVFSIWDETYCHTLTEMWAIGLPVAVFNYGTVASRVNDSGAGWVFQHEDIAQLYQELTTSIRNPESYSEKKAAVVAWQLGYGRANTAKNMASKYQSLYRSLLPTAKRNNLPAVGPDRRVAVVCPCEDKLDRAPASTFIRVWERTRNSLERENTYIRMSPAQFIASVASGEISSAIIQRNVIPAHLVDTVIKFVEEGKLHFVFDIDDDLLDVPEDKDPEGRYKRYAKSLKRLMAHATTITASTKALAERYQGNVNNSVMQVPNRLSNRIWHRRIDRSMRSDSGKSIVALYMGSPTHDEDLELLLPAFELASQLVPELKLKIVGGFSGASNCKADWLEVVPVPSISKSYPLFVEWLSEQVTDVDFALAPLVDKEFNRYKSGLKFLEYAGLGLTGVFTDCEVYRNHAQSSALGVVVPNDPDAWVRSIVTMAQNLEATRLDGEKARLWVEEHKMIGESLTHYDAIVQQSFPDYK